MTQIQRRVWIGGRVQGVGFRASTLAWVLADPQGKLMRGYVRNLSDGRVEVVVAGPEEAVERCIAWCRRGPSSSSILDVTVLEEALAQDLGKFAIRR